MIASDRVEGTPVRSTDGTRIGAIERVMIDKFSGSGPNLARIIRRPPEGSSLAAPRTIVCLQQQGSAKAELCSPGDRQNFAMK